MRGLIFGTPGIPLSTENSNTLNGIRKVKELGLGAMELEFVRSINVSKEKAVEVKALAKKLGVILTCHGQYWVNLASKETTKVKASIERIVSAARRVHECGGWSATWHMGFYLGRDKKKVHNIIRKNLKTALLRLEDEGVDLWIRPETTGKPTQWGDLDETISLSQEFENVLPCIDYGHLHARYNGANNTLEEFRGILSKLKDELGRRALDNMHIQCCGIEYSEKGERRHLNFEESDANWKDMLRSWKEFRIKGVVIPECPSVEGDALMLKRFFSRIG
ncbi:hypothetical protein D6825_01580 [Candidatus Woesearchaeota archaeon]|nr:MAG: hypothetical protein D6825_01580 [Candidatus Woesearchaeota archaeon]